MINDTSLPLVFVGTSAILHWQVAICQSVNIQVAGVIDDDYHGQGQFQGLPIIAKESDLYAGSGLEQYQFACGVNWQPDNKLQPAHTRNRLKRKRMIDQLDQSGLNIASVVASSALVNHYNVKIGHGVFIDHHAHIYPSTTVGNWTNIWSYAGVPPECVIGRNCVIQRWAFMWDGTTIEDDCYIGMASRIMRDNLVIKQGTHIHPNMTLMRSTSPDEEISLAGKDLRRVYNNPTEA
jgi:carbonic anhydrase/acetyltransferase-like protein (isoleucine patch superfamily)